MHWLVDIGYGKAVLLNYAALLMLSRPSTNSILVVTYCDALWSKRQKIDDLCGSAWQAYSKAARRIVTELVSLLVSIDVKKRFYVFILATFLTF